MSRVRDPLEIHRPGRPGALGADACVRGPGASRHLSRDKLLLAPPLPEPESTETNSHLGRRCGRSGRHLLRALGHASTDALPLVLVASSSPNLPVHARISGADPTDPGVVSCARSVTHRRMRSLTCSSPPQARIYRFMLASRARMRPIRASSPARVRSRIDGCAPSRARRLLRLGTPRIPICFARPVDPGFARHAPHPDLLRPTGRSGLRSARPASQSASSARWTRAWPRPPRPRLSHRTSDSGH